MINRFTFKTSTILVLLISFIFNFNVLASDQVQTPVENGMKLSLNQEGVHLLSEIVSKKVLRDLHGQRMGDIKTSVSGGVRLSLKNNQVWVDFGKFQLNMVKNYLALKMQINSATFMVNELNAKKKIIFDDLSVTCKKTGVQLKGKRPIYLTASLFPSVNNGKVDLQIRHMKLPISDDQYKVIGPKNCSGIFGGIVKLIVREVLKNSKDKIRQVVEDRLPSAANELERGISAMLSKRIPVKLGDKLPIPLKSKIFVSPRPYKLHYLENEWIFESSLNIISESGPELEQDPYRPIGDQLFNLGLGKIWFSYQLFDGVVDHLFKMPEISRQIAITDRLFRGVESFINRDFVETYLPDVGPLELESEFIMPVVTFTKNPRLVGHIKRGQVFIDLTGVRLTFHIKQKGEWKPYYHVNLNAKGFVQLGIEKENLDFSFKGVEDVEVEGAWDPGYTPKDPTFNKDDFLELVKFLGEFIQERNPLFSLKVNPINLFDYAIFVRNPLVDSYGVRVDIGTQR